MENPEQPQFQPQPELQAQPLPQQPESQPQPFAPGPQPVQPQYQPQQQPQPSTPQNDPGKTLGIVGFVFAFVGLQLVGLILSILGFNKSKKAGFKNTLALAGIILNAIFLLVVVPLIVFFIAVTVVSYNGITERANSSASEASAASVVKYSELYYADNGTYPKSFSELTNPAGITASKQPFLFEPSNTTEVEFYSCGELGNKIGYYNYDAGRVDYRYSGTADASTDCTFSAS